MRDSEPPVFWEKYLEECAEIKAEASRLRQSQRISNVGLGPIIELVARLAEALYEREFVGFDGGPGVCVSCSESHTHAAVCDLRELLDEADELVANATEE